MQFWFLDMLHDEDYIKNTTEFAGWILVHVKNNGEVKKEE